MKRWGFPVAAAIAVGSLVLNVGFVKRAGGVPWIVRQFSEVKTRHQCRNNRVDAFYGLPDSPNDIDIVGDSFVSGTEWWEWLQNHHARNRGVSGDTTMGVLARLDEVTKGQPRIVVLMVGINDLQYGWTVESAIERYRQIVQRIHCESPRTRIIITSVLPIRAWEHRQYFGEKVKHVPALAEVQALNEGIRNLGEYLDLWPDLVQDGQLKAEVTFDGLHVNGAGYRIWAQRLQRAMR